MDTSDIRSVLDKIDATRVYTYFRSRANGIEVWIVTDFAKDRRTFMSKEKAQSVARELNVRLSERSRAAAAYARSSAV